MNLESFPVFKDIGSGYIALLEPLFERFTCPEGEIVITQGKPADYLYLVESGNVEIFYKPYDDDAITVTHVGAGGLFGWSALVGGPDYTSSGIAIEALDAVRIKGSDLRKLCQDNPQVGGEVLERLASVVSKRWMNAHEQIKAILENGLKSSP